MSILLRACIVSSIAALSLIACGEDPAGDGNNIIPGNDGGPIVDAGGGGDDAETPGDGGTSTDAGDPDMETDMEMPPDACDLVQCSASQECVEGTCVDRDPCTEAIDAGTLLLDTPVAVSGSFLETGSDADTATCGEADQLEQLVRFELDQQAEVSWSVEWTGQFDGLVALRSICDDVSTESQCSDVELGSAILEPGEYFLYLEVRLGNPGQFSLDLEATAPPTCQIGTATCDADDRLVCVDGSTVARQTCPEACVGGSCAGDSCADPITVTGTGGTFTGTGEALTSSLDFVANTSCAEVGGMSTSTPGYDIVFFLPSLTAGNVVSIDASTGDPNVNDIFIQQTCGESQACTASYQSSETPDFVVQADGDYFVIIEKRQASNAPFQYGITIF